MEDFNIAKFIYHLQEYAKALLRRGAYTGTQQGLHLLGNLLVAVLVLALAPFVLLLLIAAAAFGLDAWMQIGLGWSCLILAGVLLLVGLLLYALRGRIVRAVSLRGYVRLKPLLDRMDEQLKPSPMVEDADVEPVATPPPFYPHSHTKR